MGGPGKKQLVTASVLNDAPLPSDTYASSISFTDKIFYHFHARLIDERLSMIFNKVLKRLPQTNIFEHF